MIDVEKIKGIESRLSKLIEDAKPVYEELFEKYIKIYNITKEHDAFADFDKPIGEEDWCLLSVKDNNICFPIAFATFPDGEWLADESIPLDIVNDEKAMALWAWNTKKADVERHLEWLNDTKNCQRPLASDVDKAKKDLARCEEKIRELEED